MTIGLLIKPNAVLQFALRHAVASVGTAAVMTVLPCIVYLAAAFQSNDPGGPMMIIIVPLLSAYVAAMFAIVLFAVMAVLQWMKSMANSALWFWVLLPLVVVAASRFLLVPVDIDNRDDLAALGLKIAYVAASLLCYALFLAIPYAVNRFRLYASIILKSEQRQDR